MTRIKPIEARSAIESHAESLLCTVFDVAERYGMKEFSDLEEELSDLPVEDTTALNLSLHDQLSLLEWHASDYDVTLEKTAIETLRSMIESRACLIIHYLATDLARERLKEFQAFCERHGLFLENVNRTSDLASVRPDAQRSEGEYCTVYECRGEAEDHIDLWHYVHEPLRVYVSQMIRAF